MATDLEQKIIKQIEYYFGDYNLSRDKFLQEQIALDNGWVELNVLLTFNRLNSLTKELEVIVAALKKSENGVVEVSEDEKKVRRSTSKPMPEFTDDLRKEFMNRTAYAKGFPRDESLDDIMSYFEQYGSIESCVKRSYLDKATKEHKFKGSCFTVFKNVDDCKKFIEAENIKYKDQELLRKWQKDYIEEKKQEMSARKNDKKKKREEKEKGEEPTITFPKGAILYFSGIPDDHVLTREEIKAKIVDINETEPSYIDYKKEDKEGYIRMPDENGAVEFHKKLTDGILEIGDVKLQVQVLEGEKEEEYLNKTKDFMSKRRNLFKKGKRNKGNNKRKSYEDGSGSRSKKLKA